MTMTFRNKQYLHSGASFLSDKTYNPLAYMMLSEFSRQKSYFKEERYITPQEKNDILHRDLGYSPQKIAAILDSLKEHGEIDTTSDGDIVIKDFNVKKKQYVTLDAATAQYFYDTFGKNGLALKTYVYLGGKWSSQNHFRTFPGGFHFTKGGVGGMSITRNLGYKTCSQATRENINQILDRLVEDGLLSLGGPHSYVCGTTQLGCAYSLDYWGPCNNSVITSVATSPSHARRFTYDIHRLRPYYMEESDPRYGFVEDVGRLGSNAVVVLYEDVDDDSLIKLLDEYPQELNMPVGRIMYSTLEPMDDDYDVI